MQNVDLPKIITTDEENLDFAPIASKGPASIDCILDATDIIDTQTGFQSDPETQRTKQKSRSRFSAAFRRLSKSTRKKEHPVVKKDSKLPEATVPLKSTVAEKSQSAEAPSIEEKPPVKKKPSLSRRFLLGGLKRTKSSTKKSAADEEDNIILVSSSGTQTTNTLERRSTLPNQQHFSQDPPQSSPITSSLKESHTSLVSAGSLSGGGGGSLQRLDRIRKVQITIRGKKIEHTQSEISVQTTGPIADSGGGGGYSTEILSNVEPTKEKDYLIPTEVEASPTTNRTKQSILVKTTSSVRSRSPSPGSSPSKSGETADPKAKPKKKLKSKKISSTTTKQIATTTTTTKTTKTTNNKKITQKTTAPTTLTQPTTTTTQSAEEKEKFIITSSTRDTPPRERAPAKPSRIVVVAGSDVAVSNVALATTSQSSTGTGAIRKQTTKAAATLKSPRLTTTTTAAKHTATKSAVSQQEKLQQQQKTVAAKSTIIEAELLKTQTDLMHNSQDGIERGHRFPRPNTPTTTVAAAIPTETIETITIGNKTPLTTTAETPSIAITAPITTRTTHSAQHQRQIQFQLQSESEASKTLSLSSSSPPQSLESKISPTTDLQTTVQQTAQSSLQPPTYPPPPIPSGTSTPATRSPDHRSHSPLPSEQLYLATRFLPGTTRLVPSTHSSDQDEAAISSAESAQQQHSSYARNYGEISFDSNKSSESQSPVSETSRKRIRYVAQPTLNDEDDIDDPTVEDEVPASRPESRREALSYLYSAVSDYSLESEEGDQGDNQQMPAFGDLTMDQVEPVRRQQLNVGLIY